MKKFLKVTAFLAVAVVLAVAGLSATATARGRGGMGAMAGRNMGMVGCTGAGPGMGMQGGMGMGSHTGMGGGMGIHMLLNNSKLTGELGLTDTQISKLRDINTEAQRTAIRTKADVDIMQLDLNNLLQQDKPDLKKVDSLIDSISAKQADMKKSRIHEMFDMKNVLTAEQQVKVKEYMARQKQQRGKNMKNRAGKGNKSGSGQRQQNRHNSKRNVGNWGVQTSQSPVEAE